MQTIKQTARAGFTLVELMVALFLGVLAVAGIYKTYVAYSTAADVQEQTLELNQNLRVTMLRLIAELRLVGLDPEDIGTETLIVPGFTAVTSSSFTYTRDATGGETDGLDNDGDDDGVGPAADHIDANDAADEKMYGDGDINDLGERVRIFVGNDTNGVYGLVREDLNAKTNGLDDDGDGLVDAADPDEWQSLYGTMDELAPGQAPLHIVYLDKDRNDSSGNYSTIYYVQISLMLRSTNQDFSNKEIVEFKDVAGTTLWTSTADGYYRRQLNAEIDLRNMSLKVE